jgi:hypothetical protein
VRDEVTSDLHRGAKSRVAVESNYKKLARLVMPQSATISLMKLISPCWLRKPRVRQNQHS